MRWDPFWELLRRKGVTACSHAWLATRVESGARRGRRWEDESTFRAVPGNEPETIGLWATRCGTGRPRAAVGQFHVNFDIQILLRNYASSQIISVFRLCVGLRRHAHRPIITDVNTSFFFRTSLTTKRATSDRTLVRVTRIRIRARR